MALSRNNNINKKPFSQHTAVNTSHYSQAQKDRYEFAEKAHKNQDETCPQHQDVPLLRIPESDENSVQGIINNLVNNGLDKDKLLILALMIILIREGADKKLILALGYILL
jgi:hypothetical protein